MADDSDKSLTLKIVTKADLAGAKAAEAALESTIAKKKYLGQSYDQEQAQLTRVKSSLADYTAKNKDASQEVEGLEASHHALHKIMHMIGSQTAPEIGEAMTGALYGPIGLAIALGAALDFVRKKFEEEEQAMEEASKAAADPEFKSAFEAKRKALEDMSVSAAVFAEKIRTLITPEQEYKAAINAATEALHEQYAAQAQIENAQKAADIAELEKKRKLGQISSTDYIIQSAAIEKKYQEMANQRQKEEADKALALKQKELEHDVSRSGNVDQEVKDRESDASAAKGKVEADKAQLEKEQELQKQREEKAKAAKDAIENPSVFMAAQIEYEKSMAKEGQMDRAPHVKAAMDAEADKKRGQDVIDSIQKRLPAEEIADQTASYYLDRARQDAEKNKTEINNLQHEIENLKRAAQIKAQAQPSIDEAQARQRAAEQTRELAGVDIGDGYTGGDILRDALLRQREAVNDQSGRDHFDGISQQDRQFQAAFEKYVASRNAMTQTLIDLMSRMAGTQSDMQTQINSLNTAIEAVKNTADTR